MYKWEGGMEEKERKRERANFLKKNSFALGIWVVRGLRDRTLTNVGVEETKREIRVRYPRDEREESLEWQ